MWQDFLNKNKTPLLIFLIVFTLFVSNTYSDWAKDTKNGTYRRLMTSGDQVSNTFLPWLMLQEKTTSFDPIMDLVHRIEGIKPKIVINTEKGYKSSYPIFPALMATPLYFFPVALQKIPELTYHENILKVFLLGRVTASFYTALSVVLFYYILKEVSKSKNWILIFTFFYAFGTSTWSISSRGMWQHTFAQLFISAIILLILRARKNSKLIPWVGLLVGVTVLARPVAIVFALVISLYVFFEYRDQLIKYILAIVPSIIFLALYNHLTFGSVLIEGYGARNGYNWSNPLLSGLAGYLVSPARSLLFLSPPLMLSFYGIYKTFFSKKFGKRFNLIFRYLSIAFLLSMLMMAKWWAWAGANAFGYRMLSDFIPIVGLLTFVVVDKIQAKYRIVILVLMVYSVFIHANAVINRKSRCSEEDNWSFYCLSPPAEKSKY